VKPIAPALPYVELLKLVPPTLRLELTNDTAPVELIPTALAPVQMSRERDVPAVVLEAAM
jgi:hypothetical protein